MAVAGLEVVLLDKVGDDFGVGLGREFVAFGDELFLSER